MREALDSHVGSHDSWIKGILSCYSKVKVKVFRIKYNKSQTGESLYKVDQFDEIYKVDQFDEIEKVDQFAPVTK